MTRTATEELEANHNESTSNEGRKSSVAKIIVSTGQNEEHIEFTQPISIKYMGEVHIHNESNNYYTPSRSPKITPNNSEVDLVKTIERAVEEGRFGRLIQRRTIDSVEGRRIQQILSREDNNNLLVPHM
jgi:hypothetical protein